MGLSSIGPTPSRFTLINIFKWFLITKTSAKGQKITLNTIIDVKIYFFVTNMYVPLELIIQLGCHLRQQQKYLCNLLVTTD